MEIYKLLPVQSLQISNALFLLSEYWFSCRHYKLPFLFLTEMMLAAELRCHCIQTVRGLMLPKHLANVEIIPKGPHCNVVEIIATLKNSQQICLDPQAKWVKMIINRILNR
uniref:C-X-C motif chemokine n=1 Tax=Athene cunicularia TaxID=194338 RepID=A0A663MS37_ATHCN